MQSKRTPAAMIALGGMLAALAVIVMAMGTLIPVATYTCPVLCMLLLQFVLKACGSRIAWAWYIAVSILSLLLAPDREASAVFVFLGYYPIIKPRLDGIKTGRLWKGLWFNGQILLLYWLVIRVLGIEQIAAEYETMGAVMVVILLILGNVTFFLLDHLLSRKYGKKK